MFWKTIRKLEGALGGKVGERAGGLIIGRVVVGAGEGRGWRDISGFSGFWVVDVDMEGRTGESETGEENVARS